MFVMDDRGSCDGSRMIVETVRLCYSQILCLYVT